MTMTKTHFTYKIDRGDTGGNVIEYVADVDDLTMEVAAYKAACERWPGGPLLYGTAPA